MKNFNTWDFLTNWLKEIWKVLSLNYCLKWNAKIFKKMKLFLKKVQLHVIFIQYYKEKFMLLLKIVKKNRI